LVLPGPSIRTSGSAMTTQSSHGSRPRWPPRTVPCGSIAPAPPCPSAVASDRRPSRRYGLPGRSGAASRQSATRPRSAADAPPPACTRLRSGARIHAPRVVDPAAGDGAGPHGTPLDPVVTAARRTEVSPIATTRRTRDETAATGRTERHQMAGRRTGWTPAGRTAASGERAR